ncbi:Predicted nuclease of the RNAse H fold, HicB family [Dyadobacter soli]|uniref:Predicted nuclease of the RNAse H fold, HicB family n=1 Tax=Dyadobacter soli TaxID=659014 RepID=A0A1G6ZYE8_9BACT|nr:type II toxin-antitoxin system HicB family antitoxin [Dyadobacter soli]SDE07267.1 Predicted nuclease of the RNAse H fold, HicB family [Dyadobacter soli]
MKLTVIISRGDEMLIGQVQEVPGVITQGENVEEVMENIQDALELYFQDSDVILENNIPLIDLQNVVLTQELEFA